MENLFCHSAIRIFPQKSNDSWLVVNLHTKINYKCSNIIVMLLVSFMGGDSTGNVINLFRKKYLFNYSKTFESIKILRNLGLLVLENDLSHQQCLSLCKKWSSFGWVDTADYQLATLDYPFADYSENGREIDAKRIKDYVLLEPDINRYKKYQNVEYKINVPTTTNVLKELKVPFSKVWNEDVFLQELNQQRCLNLLSAVFGVFKLRNLSDSPDLIAPAIHKTSPSGGARHPTEAYIFSTNINGLSKGVYHFNINDNSLDFINELDIDYLNLFRMFSGPMRASFKIDAFIVMTSVFDRSMWRYREPRSFRAIYMDVGHLCGTLDLVAKSLGLNCLVQHGISEEPIAKILGINTLTEGVIYSAAIGGI